MGSVKVVDEGAVVCRVGDESDGLHVVLAGRVRISRPAPGGHEVALGERGPTASFGEPSLLDPAPRTATVVATEQSRFFVLSRDEFLAFLSQTPSSVAAFLAGIGAELRHAQELIFSDIVNEQALQVELHAQRYRSLAQLVAGVAHEVNTPLGIINTAAGVLADGLAVLVADAGALTEPISDALEAAQLISNNLARASRLIERFKTLSARSAAMSVEETDVMVVVEEVLALFTSQAGTGRLTIETHDDRSDRSQPWVGDAGHLGEVLLNLLANIERYAYGDDGGRIDIVVHDHNRPDGRSFEIVVRDYGHGIPKEHIDRVWEPFFSTGRSRGGTGLGLSLVHNLVTDGMHGTVAIHSEPGVETAVHVCFPQRPPQLDRQAP